MAFLNKNWRKQAGDNAVDALMRVAGAGLSAVILNKVTAADFASRSNVHKTIANIAPAAWSIMTAAGDLFVAEPKIKAFCQGSYSFSIPKTVAQIAPVVGSYMGLSGAEINTIMNGIMNGVTPQIMNGTPSLPPVTPADIAKMQQRNYTPEPTMDGIGAMAESWLINN